MATGHDFGQMHVHAASLEVSQPDDPAEQEAAAVAERVMADDNVDEEEDLA